MPGYKNRFSFCPGAGSRTAVARKGLDIKRSELDSLFIQSWVSLQDLFLASLLGLTCQQSVSLECASHDTRGYRA
jgi:hypothetical protein